MNISNKILPQYLHVSLGGGGGMGVAHMLKLSVLRNQKYEVIFRDLLSFQTRKTLVHLWNTNIFDEIRELSDPA